MASTSAARRDSRFENVLAGMVTGLIAGLAGALVMNQVAPALQKLRNVGSALIADEGSEDGSTGNSSERESSQQSDSGEEQSGSQSATVTVAQAVSRTVAGRDVPGHLQETAGNVVHYAFGAVNGALYGALAAVEPRVRVGRGLVFGTALWATADEAMLPLIGLSKAPTRYPVSTHAVALAGHLAYGVTVDLVQRAVRRVA